MAYVFTVPLDILPVAAGRSVQPPVAALFLTIWVFSKAQKALIRVPSAALGALYGIVFWSFASTFWSAAPAKTLIGATSLAFQILVFVALCDTLPRHFHASFRALALSSFTLACVVLSRPADALQGGRASVAGVDENTLAMVLSVGFASCLHLLFQGRGRTAWFWAFASAVCAAATVHTGSRTGVIALAGTLVVQLLVALPLMRGLSRSIMRLVPLAIVGGLGLAGMIQYLGGLPPRITALLEIGPGVGDSGRAEILAGYRQFTSEWIIQGVGYGADADFLASHTHVFYSAHSLFWKTWIELGVVGLVFVTTLIAQSLAAAWGSQIRLTIGVLATPLVAFALTLGGLQVSVFWLVLAWSLSSRHANPTEFLSTRIRGSGTDEPEHPVARGSGREAPRYVPLRDR